MAWAFASVVLAVLLVPVLVFVGLKLPPVQSALAGWASARLEASAGVGFRAGEIDLQLLRGVVSIRDLRLAAAGHPDAPFARVERARAHVDVRALLRRRVIVRELSLDRPRLSLDAPLPPRSSGGNTGSTPLDIQLHAIEIHDGALEPPPLAAPLERWISAWHVSGIDVRGSLLGGRVTVERARAAVRIERAGQPVLELDLESALAATLDGRLEVQRLSARGSGIALDAHGTARLAARPTFEVSYEANAELARLVPALVPRGSVAARGTVALTDAVSGRAHVELLGVPVDAVARQFTLRLPRSLALAGTEVDATGEFAFDLSNVTASDVPADAVTGRATLAWRRGDRRLLDATLDAAREPRGHAARIGIEAALFPTLAGQRRATGALRLDAWTEPRRAELVDVRARVTEPDLELALKRFDLAIPRRAGAPPLGAIDATLDAAGAITAPRLRVDGTWTHAGETLARVTANASDWSYDLPPIAFELTALPDAPGTRIARGRLLGLTLADTTVHVDEPDLGAAIAGLARRAEFALPATDPPLDAMAAGAFALDAVLQGPIANPHARVDAAWQPGLGSVTVAAEGTVLPQPPFVALEHDATLTAHDIDATRFGATGLVVHAFEATTDGARLDVSTLEATLPGFAGCTAGELAASGRFDLAWPPRGADAELRVDHACEGLDRITAGLRLAEGVLVAEPVELVSGDASARLHATVPLASLAPFVAPLRDVLSTYEAGPLSVRLDPADLRALAPLLRLPEGVPAPQGTLEAQLQVVPDDPLASNGSVTLRDLVLEFDGRRLVAEQPLQLTLRDQRVELPAARLVASAPDGTTSVPLELAGSAELDRAWRSGQPFTSLVRTLAFDLHGELEAALLARRLPSTSGSGLLRIDATVRGPLDALAGEARISGPDTRISIYSQYPTRFEAPNAHLTVKDGALVLDSLTARWNSGEVELTGRVTRGVDALLKARFRNVAYRLPLGATAQLGGAIEFALPANDRPVLKGDLVVQRSSLRRNIVLDKEVLRAVLEPETLGETPYLDTIDLDLAIATDLGFKMKNNVADLHADWDRLEVSGTAAAPKLTGRVTVEPGGMVNLLGNILRIDEGTLSWAGSAPSEPIISLKTTSSIDDPSIKTQWYRYGTWYEPPMLGPGRGGTLDLSKTQATSTENLDAFAAGIATYSRDRLAGALSGGITQTEFSFQPLPLFGETDTAARMTLTQQLPPNATFVASTSATDAEAQSYIVDLHGFDFAPSVRAQVFTNDAKHNGLTLQQTVRFGKAPEETESGPLLGKLRIEAPDGIKTGKLKKAISYKPGDPLPDGAALDIELDVVDAMRGMGYPQSEIAIEKVPGAGKKVDVTIRVTPGPKVEAEFEGDRPRGPARKVIASLYRIGADEASSLEEVRNETVRALQDRGFLSPRVEVGVTHGEGGTATLHVTAEGGREVDPETLTFSGVEPREAAALAALFPSRFSRIALATGAPGSEQRIVRTLGEAGYPKPKVVARTLSEDGKTLAVQLEPGERQRIVAVHVTGLPEEHAQRTEALLLVRAGDPARAERIAGSIQAIEKSLRREGYTRVEVRPRRDAPNPERPNELALSFDVNAGPVYTVQDVSFEGITSSDEDWVRKLADVPAGAPVDPDRLAAARAALTRTGVFQRVRVTTEPSKEPAAPLALPGAAIPSLVRFDLQERQRWQLAYGGRYESEVGLGAVVDLYNFNSLGRGRTTGIRAVYNPDETSVRLYHLIPNVFGNRSSLDAFAEWKQELIEGVESKGVQGWLQVAFPLSKSWQTRVYTVVERRTLTDQTPDPNAPLDQRVISPRFGWQLAFDSRSALPGLPQRRSGFFYGLNLIGAHESLGSELTGLTTSQQWVFYVPLGRLESSRFAWEHSYRFSTINVAGEDVPYDNRLRVGGEFSVRGYRTNSLGPLDADGNALGGEVMFVANEELQAHLGRSLSALVFFDAGNVWPTLHDVGWSLSRAAGIGARWQSPIGPLRLDVAWPLDRRPNDDTYRIYFGFGTLF